MTTLHLKEIFSDSQRASIPDEVLEPISYDTRDCLVRLRPTDELTGVEFNDCIIDYTRCTNSHCIKQLA